MSSISKTTETLTPLEKIIRKFRVGAQLHETCLKSKLSPTETNRHTYLKSHCEAVVSIAEELLEEESKMIKEKDAEIEFWKSKAEDKK